MRIKVLKIILAISKVGSAMDAQISISTPPVYASIDSANSATREELFTMFKELSKAFVKFMIWLFTILAVKATDTGNALLAKHNGFMMAVVLLSLINLLMFVLGTALQLNTETRSLISILLCLEAVFRFGFVRYIMGYRVADSELVSLCLGNCCRCDNEEHVKMMRDRMCLAH